MFLKNIWADMSKHIRKFPKVIAHRGLKSELPENTKESIAAALNLPVYGVEFDVDLTLDDMPIIIHQSTMVPNKAMTALELGPRNESRSWTHLVSWNEIKNFDVGSFLNTKFADIRFSTLDQVLDLNWLEKFARIELKNPYFYNKDVQQKTVREFAVRIVKVVSPIIRNFVERGGKAQLLSFDPEILTLCKEEFPEIETTIAFDCCFDPTPEESLRLASEIGASCFIVQDQWLVEDRRWLDLSNKYALLPWAFELSPDAIQLKSGNARPQALRESWESLCLIGAAGLHCNYPAECLKFFEDLKG